MIRWSRSRLLHLTVPCLGVASTLLLLYTALTDDVWIGWSLLGAFLAIAATVVQEVNSGPVRILFTADQWVADDDGSYHLVIRQWAHGRPRSIAGVYRQFPDFASRVYAEAKELPDGSLRIDAGKGGPFDGEVRVGG